MIGGLRVLQSSFGILKYMRANYIRRESSMMEKYGTKDSWVVVTGGSDGLGLEICKRLAKQGFNICIIARNLEKMN